MQFDNWSSPPSHQVISPYASPVPRNGQKRVLKLCQLDQVWSITANRRLSYSNKIKKCDFPLPFPIDPYSIEVNTRKLLNWPFYVVWNLTSILFSILETMTFDLWTWYYLWLTLEVGATFVPTSDLRDTVVLEIHPIWPNFDNFTVKSSFWPHIQVKGQMQVKVIGHDWTRTLAILTKFGQNPSDHGRVS